MSHYLNPLHAPVPSEFHSQYTSLCHANPPLEPPFPTSLPPSFKRVPQTPLSISSPCRSGSRVPIIFELIGAPSRGLGIPMRELVVRSGGALERMIVDASEPVGYLMSGPTGIRQVTLRVLVNIRAFRSFPNPCSDAEMDHPVARLRARALVSFSRSIVVCRSSHAWPACCSDCFRLFLIRFCESSSLIASSPAVHSR